MRRPLKPPIERKHSTMSAPGIVSSEESLIVPTVFGATLAPNAEEVIKAWKSAGTTIGLATSSGVALQGVPVMAAGQVGSTSSAS